MDADLLQRLQCLAERGERLLAALEQRYAPPRAVDFAAIAYRWRGERGLQALPAPAGLPLARLHGIDTQKAKLVRNTRQFLNGLPANNALLWGARGTGKSSLVRALLQEYAAEGLRLVETAAADLAELPDIVAALAGRPERYILFVDDLSFDAHDDGYKALKAAIDGSLVALPENLLIYATSNRRHLLPEYLDDNLQAKNVDGEIHHGDAVEERLSLSERFGLWLSFYPFNQDDYLAIVRGHLDGLGVPDARDPAVERAALQWALAKGARSGRAAAQFARDWAGRRALDSG